MGSAARWPADRASLENRRAGWIGVEETWAVKAGLGETGAERVGLAERRWGR